MIFVRIEDTRSRPKARIRRMLEALSHALGRSLKVDRSDIGLRYEPGKPDHYWQHESGNVGEQELPLFLNVEAPARLLGAEKRETLFGELASAAGGALGMLPDFVRTRFVEVDPGMVAHGTRPPSLRRKP